VHGAGRSCGGHGARKATTRVEAAARADAASHAAQADAAAGAEERADPAAVDAEVVADAPA
jgi:hypothetical protein